LPNRKIYKGDILAKLSKTNKSKKMERFGDRTNENLIHVLKIIKNRGSLMVTIPVTWKEVKNLKPGDHLKMELLEVIRIDLVKILKR